MENAEVILSLTGTALSLLITCIVLVIKIVHSFKKGKAAQSSSSLLDAVAPLMAIAEQHTNYSGEEKKEFVLTKLNRFSIDNGIAFDATAITQKIEELINLTKQVNSNKK